MKSWRMDLSVVCSLLAKWILLVIIYSFLHILATKQTNINGDELFAKGN